MEGRQDAVPTRPLTVVLLGALDTRAAEIRWLRDRLHASGLDTVVMDVGVLGVPGMPVEVSRRRVAEEAGAALPALAWTRNRRAADAAMGTGAARLLVRIHDSGGLDGALAVGGRRGAALAARALAALPTGVPKMVVACGPDGIAAGAAADATRGADVVIVPSAVDPARPGTRGREATRVLSGAAAALAGMVRARGGLRPAAAGQRVPRAARPAVRPAVAVSSGVTVIACVTEARAALARRGAEAVSAPSGAVLEALVRQGAAAAVLDAATGDVAAEVLLGEGASASGRGPGRLTAAGERGLPRVVAPGGLDAAELGPAAELPRGLDGHLRYPLTPRLTLVRLRPAEAAEAGRLLGARVAAGSGRAAVFLPLGGVSALSTADGPFRDPAADRALFAGIRAALRGTGVEVVEMRTDVNHPAFGEAMAEKVVQLMERAPA
ncbi:hypothetical protein BIV57_08665 [Mangrovactinospora gilvigrisea]|uniref:Uncharacterized protein n=1 Tax=Mangrovactinospora gilvigrisea TaxID=1428644 RepID=A0A1J7BGU8_9ACTN|nr:Tm-1-like ATP-binding domain-containing protein [Mangrovactinospora gilvigrisea]OIV37915.1 hypothetical protein BIV57_08665 [Mangrovactinospora gilvigrisea]